MPATGLRTVQDFRSTVLRSAGPTREGLSKVRGQRAAFRIFPSFVDHERVTLSFMKRDSELLL